MVWVLDGRDQSCELADEFEISRACGTPIGRDSGCEFNECNEASEFDRNESDKLGGLPLMRDDLLLEEGESRSRKFCLLLSSERGRMNDMVLDLLRARLP